MAKVSPLRAKAWPNWEVPTGNEQLQLAKTLFPYIRLLSPAVVARIAEENNKHLKSYREVFTELGIPPEIYLWPDSPVAFPGIRRHVGKEEEMKVKKHRKTAFGPCALIMDDNAYAKEVWSYTLRGRKTNNKGPDDYALAHILDQKDYQSRRASEIANFKATEGTYLFAALHTSCANTVYVPRLFIKPTDHGSNLRKLLIQLVHKHYSPVCSILPHSLSLELNVTDEWRIENFPEVQTVGSLEYIEEFLKFRKSIIDELIIKNRERIKTAGTINSAR